MSIIQLLESKILDLNFDETPIIVISGPTGIGKSNLAISLAKKINGVIINADSMQIYKELKNVYAAYKDGWIEIDELMQKFGKKAVVAVAEFIAILVGVKVVVSGSKIAFKGAKKAFPNLSFTSLNVLVCKYNVGNNKQNGLSRYSINFRWC